MADKTAKDLWQDYRFLTKEMVKFLAKQDMKLFYDLMSQRERLQVIIDQTADDGFKVSTVGRSLLIEIKEDSRAIIQNMQLRLNSSKRQQQVSDAYSGYGTEPVSRMSWNR